MTPSDEKRSLTNCYNQSSNESKNFGFCFAFRSLIRTFAKDMTELNLPPYPVRLGGTTTLATGNAVRADVGL